MMGFLIRRILMIFLVLEVCAASNVHAIVCAPRVGQFAGVNSLVEKVALVGEPDGEDLSTYCKANQDKFQGSLSECLLAFSSVGSVVCRWGNTTSQLTAQLACDNTIVTGAHIFVNKKDGTLRSGRNDNPTQGCVFRLPTASGVKEVLLTEDIQSGMRLKGSDADRKKDMLPEYGGLDWAVIRLTSPIKSEAIRPIHVSSDNPLVQSGLREPQEVIAVRLRKNGQGSQGQVVVSNCTVSDYAVGAPDEVFGTPKSIASDCDTIPGDSGGGVYQVIDHRLSLLAIHVSGSGKESDSSSAKKRSQNRDGKSAGPRKPYSPEWVNAGPTVHMDFYDAIVKACPTVGTNISP